MRLRKKIFVICFTFLLMLALTACKGDSADGTLDDRTSADNDITDTKEPYTTDGAVSDSVSSAEDDAPDSNESTDEFYETGISLSDDLADFTFRLNGIVYKLPMEQEAFTKNGWKLPDYFDTTKKIASEHYEISTMKKGSEKLDVNLINMTLDMLSASQCPVGRITCELSDNMEVYLAGELLLNTASLDDVKAKYGKPFSEETYDKYIEIVYEKPNSAFIYERYTIYFDPESKMAIKIDIVNFVASKSSSDDGDMASGEAFPYTAPTVLGSDPESFTVSIMGELYNLPAPVSAFIANGWEVVSSETIGAGTYRDRILFSKDGKVFEFGVMNFADKKADVKDCAIYKVYESKYDNIGLNLVIPGEIKIGSSLSDAEKALSTLQKKDFGATIEFAINTRERMLTVDVDKDTNEVDYITVIKRIVE